MTHPSTRNKATMYRQGAGWIVSEWDEMVHCYRVSQEISYWVARASIGAANCRNPKTCARPTHQHREQA